ncbi:hypothetical protein HYW55_05170 [Candidatus Gottesmanbacteria bacterium]|nr:hypothetical protein [Candidatus Gottesmanbacteria bacterium]
MLNLNSLILFSENPANLTAFYKKVFQREPDWSGGEFVGFNVGVGMMVIGPHDKVHGKNANPERIMFNLETENVENETKRLEGLGAEVIAQPYHPKEDPKETLATFVDVDGNYFQLTTPIKMS